MLEPAASATKDHDQLIGAFALDIAGARDERPVLRVLGVASTLGLEEARKLCTARHSAAVEGEEEEEEEPWSEHDDEVWEDGSDAMDTRGAHHPPSAGTGSISAPATATAETPLSSDSNDDDVPGLLRDDGSDDERGGGGGKKVKTKL